MFGRDMSRMIWLLNILLYFSLADGVPEEGRWTLNFSSIPSILVVPRTMSRHSSVTVDIPMLCSKFNSTRFKVTWVLLNVGCYGYQRHEQEVTGVYHDERSICFHVNQGLEWKYGDGVIDCITQSYFTNSESDVVNINNCPTSYTGAGDKEGTGEPTPTLLQNSTAERKSDATIVQSWTDAPYSFWLNVAVTDGKPGGKTDGKTNGKPDAFSVYIDIKDTGGSLLSIIDLPLLYFYLVMAILYAVCCFFWIMMMNGHREDLLRIHYFILLVIAIGFAEKAFYYAEYKHIDIYGKTSKPVAWFAEIFSVTRSTLSRALYILASLGYGLVKYRLDSARYGLAIVSCSFFILSAAERILRDMQLGIVAPNGLLATAILLLICEVGIDIWIIVNLVMTYKTLRCGKSATKLSIFKWVICAFVLSFAASIGYLLWILLLNLSDCVTDFRFIWMRSGFWPILGSAILLVITILWRPSNNDRFSDQIFHEENDEEHPNVTKLFGMEIRNRAEDGSYSEL